MLRLSSSTCSLHVVSRERRFSPNYYYVRERRGGECRGEEDGNGGRKNVVFAWRCCEKGRRGDSVPAVEQRCTSAPLLFSSSNLFWPGFWSRKCCSLGIFNTSMLTFLVEFFEVDHLGFVACFEIIKIFSIVPRRNRTRGKVTIVGRESSIETVQYRPFETPDLLKDRFISRLQILPIQMEISSRESSLLLSTALWHSTK